jgi:hypothetical protein
LKHGSSASIVLVRTAVPEDERRKYQGILARAYNYARNLGCRAPGDEYLRARKAAVPTGSVPEDDRSSFVAFQRCDHYALSFVRTASLLNAIVGMSRHDESRASCSRKFVVLRKNPTARIARASANERAVRWRARELPAKPIRRR